MVEIRRPRLRIAHIAPPGIPCPPRAYGASELVTSVLTEALVAARHEVILFAHPDSETTAQLVSFPEVYEIESAEQREVAHSALAVEYASGVDVIHNHCIFPGPSLVRAASAPSLTTLHYTRPILRAFAGEPYVAVSRSQAQRERDLNVVGVVHNAIDPDEYAVIDDKAGYLLWIGRIDPKKAPHLAIEIAHRLDLPLLLAAASPSGDNIEYWEQCVGPLLGGKVEYIGEVTAAEKPALYGRARCVLMPQQWDEPFGLVAIEALAAGTPVVALRRGALPEIVPHGEAGFVVDSVDEMVDAVTRVGAIDPWACRRVVEENFTPARQAAGYLEIYRALVRETVNAESVRSGLDPVAAR